MSKIKIKLIFLGHPPHNINISKIKNWESKLFEIVDPIDNHTITTNADVGWGFSDHNIENMLPNNEADVLIAITSVPLEDNYYARRFTNNRLCITFSEIGDFLKYENIPLENLILRVLYSASFIYKRFNKQVPTNVEFTSYTHDETRGCLFDMNGIKNDIIYSTNKPILCDSCIQSLRDNRIESNLIDTVKTELKKINKPLYYRISDLIKDNPICAIIISALTAVILGAFGSLFASYLWERF